MIGTAIKLIGLKDLHIANYLPALFLAPFVTLAFGRLERRKAT